MGIRPFVAGMAARFGGLVVDGRFVVSRNRASYSCPSIEHLR